MFPGKNSSKLVVLSVASIFLAGAAQAAVPPRQGTNIFFSAGLGASYGTMVSENQTTVASRGFGVYGVSSDLGVSIEGFMIGAGVAYDLWKQVKSPSDLNGSNMQGNEFSIGPSLGYNFGSFTLLGRYYLSSTYSLDKQNSSGQDVALTKPETSFVVQVRIPIGNGAPYVGAEYKSLHYERMKTAGVESTLSSKINLSSYGLILGVAF